MNQSGSSLNKSAFLRKQQTLGYVRVLYILVAIELIISLIWASFCMYWWKDLGAPIVDWWYFGVVAASMVVVLILVAQLMSFAKRFPINWVIYILFTLSLAHLAAFLSCVESKGYFYFALWVLTAIITGLAFYFLVADNLPNLIEASLISFGIGAAVLIAFIVLTDKRFFILVLVYVATAIWGVYMSFNLRAIVRSHLNEDEEEDSVTGAVRIWLESVLVFCRVGELYGSSIYGGKQVLPS
jgi:FtsH-binding integral membrane protein